MVDIHSHILPGFDDGAQTLEQSLEMLRLATASGTTDIVATPHANSEFKFDPVRVKEAVRELSDRIGNEITLHTGCDFHFTYENVQDAFSNPEKYTINGRGYLMVELPDDFAPAPIRNALCELMGKGIIPVITHPERNPMLRGHIAILRTWVDDGCCLQVTGQSFLGRFGASARRSARALMRAQLVHFVASDAHDCADRTPDLQPAYEYVKSHYGPRRAEELFIENPAAALQGEPLIISPAKHGFLSKLFFWK